MTINALWRVWEDVPTLNIPDTTYTLKGFSIAALRTNFYIEELGIMLDAGISANFSPDHIFITHSHADHVANLPYHLYNKKPNTKTQIYIPAGTEKKIKNLLQASYALCFDDDEDVDDDTRLATKHHDLISVTPSKDFELNINGKKIKVEIIACDHSVKCVGYGFVELRNKLKPEYIGLDQKAIINLKKNNVEITYIDEKPFLLFVGDTSKAVLGNNLLTKYKNIIIECTFILDDDLDNADKTKHMHWNYLLPYVLAHPEINFILYHFSQRYKKKFINEFFEKLKLKNVIIWVNNND